MNRALGVCVRLSFVLPVPPEKSCIAVLEDLLLVRDAAAGRAVARG